MSDILDDLGLPPEPVAPLLARERIALDFSPEAVAHRKAVHLVDWRQVPHSRRSLDHIHASQVPTDQQDFDDELVEGLIGRGGMIVVYGDSNTGKTFLVVELAACVAVGRDFLGRRTVGGLVLYLATEAVASVELRFAAWQRENMLPLGNVVIVRSPVNLFEGDADADALIDLVTEIEARTGGKVQLIVADTLARIAAGANENAGQDMGKVFARAERVRQAIQACFCWVAHIGKDAGRGLRGWSGMRAAIDTEVEITVDDATGARCAEVTKQRDLPGKGDRLGFRLQPVVMGVNLWGTDRTTCIVQAADAPARPTRTRESAAAGAIVEFLTQRGSGCLTGAMCKHFEGRIHRATVYREVKRMVTEGTLIQAGNVIALPGSPAKT